MTRQAISKKLRFEVFKRDKFSCQYCGASAPDAILHVDHIEPVSKGGGNDILNLITACRECNSGKSDRRLGDHSELAKQRAQLEELSERRDQLQQLIKWRDGLKSIDEAAATSAFDAWDEIIHPFSLNDYGRAEMRKLLKKFGLPVLFQAMDRAAEQYIEYDNDGPKGDSASAAFRKIGGICFFIANPEKQSSGDVFYVRGILRKRLSYVNEAMCLSLLKRAEKSGMDMESAKDHAKTVGSWTEWRNDIEDFLASNGNEGAA